MESPLVISGSGGLSIQGEYHCYIERRIEPGEARSEKFASATVYYYPSIVIAEPVRLPEVPQRLSIGDSVRYNCTMRNHEEKQWINELGEEITNSSDGRIVVEENGALVMKGVTHASTNQYYCYGYIYTLPGRRGSYLQTKHLYRPILVTGIPTIKCNGAVESAAPGSTVMFSCVVQGYPAPNISWSVPTKERVSNNTKALPNSYYRSYPNTWNAMLSFRSYVHVNDSGRYELRAENEHGIATSSITLNVLHTPDELEAPVLSLVNATTVRVEWSAPTNADPEELNILYYMVLFGVVDSTNPRSQINASSNQRLLEVPLLPDTEYYFAVGAVNQVSPQGAGLSPESKIRTKESVPSFPLNVAVNSVTPQTAVVSWDQLTGSRTGGSNGQLTIKSYILTYKSEKEDWMQAKRISLDKNSLSAVLDNLKANTNYIVSVRGENDLGEGIPAFSSVFSTLSLSPPGTPVHVKPAQSGTNRIYVCWTNGPQTYHVEDYIVTLYTWNGTHHVQYRQVYAEDTRMNEQQCAWVNGLEVNKCYFFSVVVVNAAGQSEESAVSLNDICTVSAVTSGLTTFTQPSVLVPFVLSLAAGIIIVALIVLICLIRRGTRKNKSVYVMNPIKHLRDRKKMDPSGQSHTNGTKLTPSEREKSTAENGRLLKTSNGSGPSNTLQSISSQHSQSGYPSFSITAESGIPDIPILEEKPGPAAKHPWNPPPGYGPQDDCELEAPLQWTFGPAHESRDTPPVVERFASIDPSDSGFDYSEDVSSHIESLPSVGHNFSAVDENEEFDYTDNVAYGKVTLKQNARKSSGVTLVVDPNTPDKELVIFHSKRSAENPSSRSNLQTNI
jgi:hypothetical protein